MFLKCGVKKPVNTVYVTALKMFEGFSEGGHMGTLFRLFDKLIRGAWYECHAGALYSMPQDVFMYSPPAVS